jgi:hypothetical protein
MGIGDEDPKEAFEKVAKALESLLDTWQGQLAAPHDGEEWTLTPASANAQRRYFSIDFLI